MWHTVFRDVSEYLTLYSKENSLQYFLKKVRHADINYYNNQDPHYVLITYNTVQIPTLNTKKVNCCDKKEEV